MTLAKTPPHRIDRSGGTAGFVLQDDGTEIVLDALAASNVTVDPSGLVVVTTSDVQAALAELDAAIGGGGGPSLTVQDENSNFATGVTQIDFQGAGVTVTSGTGEVIVTIPGATGSTANYATRSYARA